VPHGVHVTGVYLIGVCLIGVHLMGVHHARTTQGLVGRTHAYIESIAVSSAETFILVLIVRRKYERLCLSSFLCDAGGFCLPEWNGSKTCFLNNAEKASRIQYYRIGPAFGRSRDAGLS
jgi:hypothetical protein